MAAAFGANVPGVAVPLGEVEVDRDVALNVVEVAVFDGTVVITDIELCVKVIGVNVGSAVQAGKVLVKVASPKFEEYLER